MAKGIIACQFLGRFGNNCFSYAAARSYAERNNLELQTDPWIGQRVFGLTDPPIANPESLKRVDENTIEEGMEGVLYRSYSQQAKCLTYTRSDCLRWFQFTDEIKNKMAGVPIPEVVAHRRVGDFIGYGFTVPTIASYLRCCVQHGLSNPHFITEENPTVVPGFDDEMSAIPDFYILSKAPVLLRANSTFSWWAATLGDGDVYSPVVDGVKSGEQDVNFILGNHPRLSHHPFVTELKLKP